LVIVVTARTTDDAFVFLVTFEKILVGTEQQRDGRLEEQKMESCDLDLDTKKEIYNCVITLRLHK
jgi:hypothetical protein